MGTLAEVCPVISTNLIDAGVSRKQYFELMAEARQSRNLSFALVQKAILYVIARGVATKNLSGNEIATPSARNDKLATIA